MDGWMDGWMARFWPWKRKPSALRKSFGRSSAGLCEAHLGSYQHLRAI